MYLSVHYVCAMDSYANLEETKAFEGIKQRK